jgi:hypothetical protein
MKKRFMQRRYWRKGCGLRVAGLEKIRALLFTFLSWDLDRGKKKSSGVLKKPVSGWVSQGSIYIKPQLTSGRSKVPDASRVKINNKEKICFIKGAKKEVLHGGI